MANQIILKKSSVVSKVPATGDLAYGELALNYADGKLYYKRSDNIIDAFAVASNFALASHTHDYLPLSGGTLTGVLTTPNGTHGIVIGDDSRLADRNVANTLFVEGAQNTDRGYINFSTTTGNSLGAIAGGALTWNGSTIWHAGNDGSGSGLDADTLDGNHASAFATASHTHSYLPLSGGTLTGVVTFAASQTWPTFNQNTSGSAATLTAARNINGTPFNGSADITTTEWIHSDRDFVNGTLITTSIDYSVINGDPFVLEIKGNSYGALIPLNIQLQGYIYNNTIINYGAYSTGAAFPITAMNVGGKLCFWFARGSYWQGFNVIVYTAYSPRALNKVTSITDAVNPNGTKQVTITPEQILRSGNYANYVGNGSLTVTAGTDITGGGLLGTANQSVATSVTIHHANTTRDNTTSSAAPARNGTFTVVDSVTTNARGHVTAVNTKTITLPDFEIVSISKSLTLSASWQDTGISSTDLTTGSYIIQVENVSDNTVGGQQYHEYYTGVMSWFSGGTNSGAADEIALHRAGYAPNAGALFLRVQRTAVGVLKLQISGTTDNTGPYTYNFKFRQMI